LVLISGGVLSVLGRQRSALGMLGCEAFLTLFGLFRRSEGVSVRWLCCLSVGVSFGQAGGPELSLVYCLSPYGKKMLLNGSMRAFS